MNELENQYLMHYGIKRRSGRYPFGSGERPYQHNSLTNTKRYNFDKWGKTRDNNTLFITGYSGSGKSTIAEKLADNNTDVIHLDLFLEKNEQINKRNKNLVKYLKDKNFDIDQMTNMSLDRKERWKYLDKFADEYLPDFSKRQYDKNRKVIVEGVQLSDETIYPNKKYFSGKPIIIMNTSAIKSFYRAGIRDEKFSKHKWTAQDVKEYINWYSQMHKNLSKLEKEITADRGKTFILNNIK